MQCPVCAALHREHNQECEVEAKATLQQRSRLLSNSDADSSARDQECQDVVLRSRKKQVQISSKMEKHKAKGHAA
jgi:hypothetical protein